MRQKARAVWLVSVIFLLALSLFLAPAALAQGTAVDEVGKELICQCGCNQVLANCVHLECPVRGPMRATISAQLNQGKSKGEIIQYFVGLYGEEVLAAPTKKGFNLTAWILPFAALLAGGGVVYWLLRTWAFRGKEEAMLLEEGEIKVEDEYRRRVEAELRKFGEER